MRLQELRKLVRPATVEVSGSDAAGWDVEIVAPEGFAFGGELTVLLTSGCPNYVTTKEELCASAYEDFRQQTLEVVNEPIEIRRAGVVVETARPAKGAA